MNRLAKQLGRALVACLFVTCVPCVEAVIVIDDFDTPDGPIAVVMPLLDGETAFVETTNPEILGGQRDMLFEIMGSTPRLVGFSAEVNGGEFWYDGHTPGTSAILQYDGLDTDILGSPPQLVRSEALGGIDLTQAGRLFMFSLRFASIDHPMDIEIDVHSGLEMATFSGTLGAHPGTPTIFKAMFDDFSGDNVFGDATSIELRFNPQGAEDIDFQLRSIAVTAPEPSAMITWGVGLFALLWYAVRRRRQG